MRPYASSSISERCVVGLLRSLATNYAAFKIRVNSVHPTGVGTPTVQNEVMRRILNESPHF